MAVETVQFGDDVAEGDSFTTQRYEHNVAKELLSSDFDVLSREDPPDDEPTPARRVDPSEGSARDPPGIHVSDVPSRGRSLEPIASTDQLFLRTLERSNNARRSRGIDPPANTLDDSVTAGDANVLTSSGDSQQQRSPFDPIITETVESDTGKQSSREHNLVDGSSESLRLAVWSLWSGLVRLVGSGLGLALLLASGWFIGLHIESFNRSSRFRLPAPRASEDILWRYST